MTIAASLTFAFAQAADAAPRHRNHKHRSHHAMKHRAHKAGSDLAGYEFELIVEGPHVLTPEEELEDRVAVEAADHPGPSTTPREEETPTQPEA